MPPATCICAGAQLPIAQGKVAFLFMIKDVAQSGDECERLVMKTRREVCRKFPCVLLWCVWSVSWADDVLVVFHSSRSLCV